MQDYQSKYLQEKKKYDNLLRMQQTILTDNDQYIAAFNIIKQSVNSFEGNSVQQQQEITGEEAQILAQKVCKIINKKSEQCQCERWRNLYQQECKDSARISYQKEQLLKKIIQKQKDEELDRVEINKLLNDYLQIYKKNLQPAEITKSEVKKKRSKSKGHGSQSSTNTQRKPQKQISQNEAYVKNVIQKFEKDSTKLHSQVESMRMLLLQKDNILKLYRQKQRKHLMAGGELLGL